MTSVGTPLLWAGFAAVVVALLALDLGFLHRRAREISVREALAWSGAWIAVSLVFCGAVYVHAGAEPALEFLTAYVVEKSLSIDNVFVFLALFSAFAVPPALRPRVLFWGVMGALVLRAIFVLLGVAVLQRFHWISFVFGALLVAAGVRMLLRREGPAEPEKSGAVRLVRRFVPAVPDYRGTRWFVRENGRLLATPLLLALVAIETSDVVFAVDSVPAVFAVTTDPFIVYTSNVFAVLGLRALYFALAGALEKVRYLNVGLALVLAFVGVKMLIAPFYQVPTAVSLAVIAALLGAAVTASLATGMARKVVVLVAGSAVTAVGIAMIVLPGPAIVVIPLGLAILATEFGWARRLLDRLKGAFRRLRARVARGQE